MSQPSAVDDVIAEYEGLEQMLADPALHDDPVAARKAAKRYSQLSPIIATYRKLTSAQEDLEAAREFAYDDAAFAAEIPALQETVDQLSHALTDMLAPRDPHDGDNIVLEVKSGEGGEESALFAADLARMYLKYAEKQGWKTEVLDSTTSDLGGFKDITVSVKARNDSPDGVWARLKFEGGVHRVQRVPVTESQGRIHTSAAGVYVFPEPEEAAELQIDDSDLRIDVFRASGKGGQGVNTTDSAVRITHLPTGLVVSCQNERSQLQNKARAMQVLAARLQAIAEDEAEAENAAGRKSQVRTVDRSERIRTYNFPENRLADHRIGFKSHNLDAVLAGELDPVLDALADAERQARLQAE
ncbi:peptide chain release factor 1 [Hoyosella rhizosphaerae]|uniref:Peptide chain release factor 1 n=1 Tax=Hoyosella rhizosphaerae TaxID=1755582 RepID=A0A916XHA8_9ACTN|nr:peptide chain release factor 1 [Hoyosella rhizosphaerae]MBN4927844.1 peptide chain release factor 1 [Hoyosella rhizosphaerae]GGC70409.1 peptide chain release factor 1 [Hoyosella rhizosphaerae]